MSYISDRPVADLIRQRIPATIQLALGSALVMLLIGANRRVGGDPAAESRARLVGVIIAIALATPTFWLGLLFILYFSVSVMAPASGYVSFVESPVDAATHLLLPALTLGTYGTAVLIRFLNASISDALQADYVRVAYGKGLAQRSVVIPSRCRLRCPRS